MITRRGGMALGGAALVAPLLACQAVAQNGTTSGPVAVSGAGGATYLGFYGTGGAQVHTVTVTTDAAAQGFAVGEFGVAERVSFGSIERWPHLSVVMRLRFAHRRSEERFEKTIRHGLMPRVFHQR